MLLYWVAFFPLCGGGEQSVLKDVFWLVWLEFIKSKVSHSGMFVLKAWNKHKQSSMKSVLLLFFFYFPPTSFLMNTRKARCQGSNCEIAKVSRAFTINGSGTRIPLSVYLKYLCSSSLQKVKQVFLKTCWDAVSLFLQLEKSLTWNKLDFSVD